MMINYQEITFLFIEKRFYTKTRFLIKQILPAEVLRKSCENTIFIALNLIANQSTMKNEEIERQGQILIAFIHSDINYDLYTQNTSKGFDYNINNEIISNIHTYILSSKK